MRIIINIAKKPFLYQEISDVIIKTKIKHYEDKFEILNYLNSSIAWKIRLDKSLCIYDNSYIFHTETLLTDGVWAWSYDIHHYISDHNFELPESFVKHIRKLKYCPKKISNRKVDKTMMEILDDKCDIIFKDMIKTVFI